MVAPRFPETDGRLDGVGGIWPNELSPAGNASGAVHEKRRMDNPRQSFVLRDRNAATHWSDSADRGDSRRTPDQTGRQSASSGEWRSDGYFCAGLASRSLRPG